MELRCVTCGEVWHVPDGSRYDPKTYECLYCRNHLTRLPRDKPT